MINRLPPEYQRDLRAARANTLLLRYNIALLAAVGFMLAAFVVTYLFLTIGKASAESTIETNRAKQTSYAETQQQATEFRNNLTTAKQIFANQINYSGLILDIARTLPRGTILQQISLDAAEFGKPTTLTAKTTSYNSALTLKDTLAKNTKIFSDVNIQSITADKSNRGYPFNVVVNLTINKGAAQ